MEEQLDLLIRLQTIDSKIRACAEEKNRLPDVLAALEQKRSAGKEELEKVKGSLHAAQKDRRERDKDLEAGLQKVEKLKGRTSEIKTNKEYQALLKEIEAAEQENKAVEDDILALMEKIENATAALKAAEGRAAQEETAIAAERRQHEERAANLDRELESLNQSRQEAASRINPPLLKQYQKLLQTIGGNVIVEAVSESCAGCHMSIPPQLYVNVKKNDGINACPHCRRILYYKEAVAATDKRQ